MLDFNLPYFTQAISMKSLIAHKSEKNSTFTAMETMFYTQKML